MMLWKLIKNNSTLLLITLLRDFHKRKTIKTSSQKLDDKKQSRRVRHKTRW